MVQKDMQNPYKTYKTSVALSYFFKKNLVGWCIVGLMVFGSIFSFSTNLINLSIYLIIIGLMLFILAVGLLLNRLQMGIRVKMFDDRVWIYRAKMFMLRPANNELVLSYAKSGYVASVVVTYSNIVSVRRISKEEVNGLLQAIVPVGGQKQLPLKFVCDYNNLVEITTSELTEPDFSVTGRLKALSTFLLKTSKIQVQNEKLLVSINNPEDFIQEVAKKQATSFAT